MQIRLTLLAGLAHGGLLLPSPVVLSAAAFKIVAAGVVRPALAADASNVMRVAELWCAACHVVTVSQREANADAPPFEEIAKRPNFSEPGLVTFLLDPHAKMPNNEFNSHRGQ
jgi:hypothetical protein